MQRIKELRESSNLTQEEVATNLNISRGTYKNYETGITRLNDEILLKLSKFYNVSTDYILGNNTKGMTVYSEEQSQIIKMMIQLNEVNLMKLYSYTAGLLAAQN